MTEKIIEAEKHIPQEQAQNHTVEQIVEVPVTPVMEEILEVVKRMTRNVTEISQGGCGPRWDRAEDVQGYHVPGCSGRPQEGLGVTRDAGEFPAGPR